MSQVSEVAKTTFDFSAGLNESKTLRVETLATPPQDADAATLRARYLVKEESGEQGVPDRLHVQHLGGNEWRRESFSLRVAPHDSGGGKSVEAIVPREASKSDAPELLGRPVAVVGVAVCDTVVRRAGPTLILVEWGPIVAEFSR